MNCENALELMNRELDEALTAEESAALQAHLDACPDCRETWRQLHKLDALLQESELEPPAALHDGVMRAIRQEQRKPRRAWLPAAAIAAAAALVLLAGKAGLIALPGFEQTDVISVNIGSAVEQIFAQTGAEAPDEAAAQQAAELSAETGLDVLLVWNSGVPAELETTPYETAQSGARLYRVTGQLAQAILDGYITAAYSPDDVFSDLPEKEAAYVLVLP
ncbi:MAG: anti-sigma factor [Oscillospiraceae bacterium]